MASGQHFAPQRMIRIDHPDIGGQPAPDMVQCEPNSKDHRPDLKQLVEILTVSADGAVPLTYRLADGNTEDSTTHIGTWDELVAMLGTADFLYVADCKLATRHNMDHIAGNHGRFLTILPRSRAEDEIGRRWIAEGGARFEQIARRPGKNKFDPPQVWWAAEAPAPSAEGYRIVWVRSSEKRAQDAAARTDRIEQARTRLGELNQGLSSPRCRLKTKLAVHDAATAVLTQTGAARWVHAEVVDTVEHEHRQARRGRPGKNTVYRRIERHHFSLNVSTDAEAVAFDAASDGCFPFITNETTPPAELLRVYKAQPHLERRHATYKGVIEAAPVLLKNDARIDALGFCLYVALLVHALVERELRQTMAAKGIASLPLYHEDRPCKAPTAARVFELLDPLTTTTVLHDGQILTLLKVPISAYQSPGHTAGNSR